MLSTLITELIVALAIVAVAVTALLRRGRVGSGSIAQVLVALVVWSW